MHTRLIRAWLGPVAAAGMLAAPALQAQVVREDGVKSIAGVATRAAGGVEWTFRSAGGEILFASIDGDIYKESVATDHAASAPGEDDEEGGPGLFSLQVLDPAGNVVCAARRPTPPPGWQRDPRMACVLATAQVYRVRVQLIEGDHLTAPSYPFLLNLSLRTIARPGTDVQKAIAASQTGSF